MFTSFVDNSILAGLCNSIVAVIAGRAERVRTTAVHRSPSPQVRRGSSYRNAQRVRAMRRTGNLADYAWYGSSNDWQRAKALAHAGREDLI